MPVLSDNKRIAKNTLFLYMRMLLVMAVTLYTSRVVLQALGVEDFGIYNVVGGVVAMLGFFNSSLANVTQRYINIGLGRNSREETERAFRQSLTLMCLLSVFILIVGESLGLWFVCNKLVIPPDRLSAAVWVYQFSLISIISAIVQVPLMGSVVAHERMNMYAYLGLFEAFAKLGMVYFLQLQLGIDELVLYGLLMAVISLLTWSFYAIYCRRNFSECRFKFYWNRPLVVDMSKFISQNLFGCFAWSAGIQGSNIILNLFFGPVVNASRAISVQVNTVVARFTENIMTAVKPPIIKSYVTGDMGYMISLIERSSKYAFFLAAVLAFPIMAEIEFILHLWLGQVPDYAPEFTRLVLCESLVGTFIPSLWIAANATGKIMKNQVYGRLFTLAILPLSYLFLKIDANPIIPFAIAILANVGYWLYSLYDIHKQIHLSIRHYAFSVVRPSLLLSAVMTIVGAALLWLMPNGSFSRFVIVVSVMIVAALVTIYCMLDSGEKKVVKGVLRKVCKMKETE